MTPSADEVRQQLERILASATFSTAGRHSRLLRYVVERALAGEGEQLKEYVLGTEVFDRPDTYDPRIDSIVRVEARRLRNRLEGYYENQGANDPVVISIPRGSYVPEFTARTEPPSSVHPAAATIPVRPRSRLPVPVWAIAAALVLAVSVMTVRLLPGRSPAAEAAMRPAMAVLPFEIYSSEPGDRLLAARITDEVTAGLARLGSVAVASRTSARQFAGEQRVAKEIADALDVGLLVEASVEQIGPEVRVVVRLVDASRDRKVWVEEYESEAASVITLSRRIAGEVAAAAVAFTGRSTPGR